MSMVILSFVALAILFLAFIIVAGRTWPLPDVTNRARVKSIPASEATTFGRNMVRDGGKHHDLTGVIPIKEGYDALHSRLHLTEQAEESLDVQYYIWHDDVSGILLLDALFQASVRGVKVRLLLDDNGIPGLDQIVATLNIQDNFEIRLFNPSTVRRPKYLGYAFDFMRMNRRMHNKAFIADGAVAIVGGRNIGDEYFEMHEGSNYVDMDVLAVGKAVPETAQSFDDYWNSDSVFEAENIINRDADLASFQARVNQVKAGSAQAMVKDNSRITASLYFENAIEPEWTTVQLMVDDPVKGEGTATSSQLMVSQLSEIFDQIEHRLDLVSAYFIPGKTGTAFFAQAAKSGKTINILTNAMSTTDVLMVHAGYSKYRYKLLKAGVRLFELKLRKDHSTEKAAQIKPLGISGASLHAKTFAVDGKQVFIGSFNFDARSVNLNCEMGFLIDSSLLCGLVHKRFDSDLEGEAYRPTLTSDKQMVWLEKNGESLDIYKGEPGTSIGKQFMIAVVGLLPIEWLL